MYIYVHAHTHIHSHTFALFAFNDTVRYLRKKDSNVFICSLHTTKAHNRVNHHSFYEYKLQHCLPKIFLNMFLSWFSSLNWQMCWAKISSDINDCKIFYKCGKSSCGFIDQTFNYSRCMFRMLISLIAHFAIRGLMVSSQIVNFASILFLVGVL